MTVKELIEFLQTKDQELQVAYAIYSEYALLEKDEIWVEELCKPRDDGWVQCKRPDKESIKYLVFPGN